MVTAQNLQQMQTDLMDKKCQVHVIGHETTTSFVGDVIKIKSNELYHPAIHITFKNGNQRKGGPSLTVYEPFTFTKKLTKGRLVYEFRRDLSPFLLIEYVNEK